MGPVPGVLEPKQQVQVHLTLQCLAPFTAPPALALSYGVAGAPALSALPLRLPVAMHKFMAPEVHIPKESFFEHWRTAPPHCKAQEMVDRGAAGPLSSEAVQVSHVHCMKLRVIIRHVGVSFGTPLNPV